MKFFGSLVAAFLLAATVNANILTERATTPAYTDAQLESILGDLLVGTGLSGLGCTTENSDISITTLSGGLQQATITGSCLLSGATVVVPIYVLPSAVSLGASQRARTKRSAVRFDSWA
ncbi:hypothetical protein T439DRAFT_328387 [Meredithblackwellia eburnea MCA 4105]